VGGREGGGEVEARGKPDQTRRGAVHHPRGPSIEEKPSNDRATCMDRAVKISRVRAGSESELRYCRVCSYRPGRDRDCEVKRDVGPQRDDRDGWWVRDEDPYRGPASRTWLKAA
jgi:hypothetical protein